MGIPFAFGFPFKSKSEIIIPEKKKKFVVGYSHIAGLTSSSACCLPVNDALISTMAAEVCPRIVNVIVSNFVKQRGSMQNSETRREGARGTPYRVVFVLSFKLCLMHRSDWGVNSPVWAGDIGGTEQGGTVVLGADRVIVWGSVHMGRGW